MFWALRQPSVYQICPRGCWYWRHVKDTTWCANIIKTSFCQSCVFCRHIFEPLVRLGRGMQAGRIKVERPTLLVGPELRSCRLQRRIFDVAISLTLLIGSRRHACTESNFSHSISRRPTSTSLVNSRTMAPLYHCTLALEYLQCHA
jgi:hypothetical protein